MAARLDNRIRELRLAAGLSVADLAERVGTTSATVSRLESGSRGLTLEWMRRLALAMGVRAADLIIEDGDTITFAQVTGDIRAQAGATGDATGWKGHVRPRLIPVPVKLPTERPIDAFRTTERGYVFCVEAFPDAQDRDRRFVILFTHIGEERLDLRTFELVDGTHGGFYSKAGSPGERWLKVSDPRINRIWKVLAEFRED
jgi:transcriptional regulator with XRE-family HTH domain